MISVLMEGYPFDKEYIELPLCGERMDTLLTYGGVEYAGVRDGKGRLSEVLRARPMTGTDLRELNLLAYVLTRLDGTGRRKGPTEKMLELESRLVEDSYSLRELINEAYAVDVTGQPHCYTGDNLDQLLRYERDAYRPCLNMRLPKPEPWRKIGDMEEGKLYWMTGISQFSDYQVFIREGDNLIQCPAWRNRDESLCFSEVVGDEIVYTIIGLPAPEMTLEAVDELMEELDIIYSDGYLPANARRELVSSSLLPEEFAQSQCEAQQMGGQLS